MWCSWLFRMWVFFVLFYYYLFTRCGIWSGTVKSQFFLQVILLMILVKWLRDFTKNSFCKNKARILKDGQFKSPIRDKQAELHLSAFRI